MKWMLLVSFATITSLLMPEGHFASGSQHQGGGGGGDAHNYLRRQLISDGERVSIIVIDCKPQVTLFMNNTLQVLTDMVVQL